LVSKSIPSGENRVNLPAFVFTWYRLYMALSRIVLQSDIENCDFFIPPCILRPR